MKRLPTGLASGAATLLTLFLTLLPGEDFPEVGFTGLDKVAHFLLFGALAAALRFDFPRLPRILPFFGAAALGLGIEFAQRLVPGRSYDLMDFAFDAAGALLAVLLYPKPRR